MDISKYIQEIDDEILGQKEALVRKMVEVALQKHIFSEQNISTSLISLLMQKANVKIPTPEVPELPERIDSATDEFSEMQGSAAEIFTDLLVGNNVYLYGKAGTGKTTLAKKIASFLLQRETFVINCNQFTSPINIIGGQTIEGYKQGQLSLAWEKGGVLILDELPKLDPNTAGLLNEALAEAAAVTKETEIDKEKYNSLKKMIEDAGGRELGFALKSADGKYYRIDYPTITDGRGVKLRKHPKFSCIGTGNTNMKEISQNFSGNNRQDYSLVDRFAGSFYEIEYDVALENKLIYKRVLEVSRLIRGVLDNAKSIESISLRTMLNFNRIWQQECLRAIRSRYAIPPIEISTDQGTTMRAKTLKDSIESFLKTLPPETKNEIVKMNIYDILNLDIDISEFIEEFEKFYGQSPDSDTANW